MSDAFVPADAYIAPSEDRADIKPLVRGEPPFALPPDAERKLTVKLRSKKVRAAAPFQA